MGMIFEFVAYKVALSDKSMIFEFVTYKVALSDMGISK